MEKEQNKNLQQKFYVHPHRKKETPHDSTILEKLNIVQPLAASHDHSLLLIDINPVKYLFPN